MAYQRRSAPDTASNRVFRCIFPANTELPGSVAEILEAPRRRADHDIPLRCHLEYCEAALHEPAGGKAKEPVDPGKPARVEDCLLREGLAARAMRQHPGECCGVITERCQAWRVMAVDRPEVLLEDPPRLGGCGREPATDKGRLAADIGHVPEPAAEQLHWFRAALRFPDLPGDLFERAAAFGKQQGVEGREPWRGDIGGGGSDTPRDQAVDRWCGIAGARIVEL